MYKHITVNCLEELYNSPKSWKREKAAMTNDKSQDTIRQERFCATHVKWDNCNNKGIIRRRIVFISEKSFLWRTPYVFLWSICPSSIAESQQVISLEFFKDLPPQITHFLKMTICILYLNLMESLCCYLQYQNFVIFNQYLSSFYILSSCHPWEM